MNDHPHQFSGGMCQRIPGVLLITHDLAVMYAGRVEAGTPTPS